jgi:hypothetical protein
MAVGKRQPIRFQAGLRKGTGASLEGWKRTRRLAPAIVLMTLVQGLAPISASKGC